jgi:hypothetical protein
MAVVSSTRRQRAIEFSTPKVADLVVVEVVDGSKKIGSASTAGNTAYGTAHPNTDKFPNFKLALIKNADDEQGQFQYWYYVKDRASQDDYNWEFQAAGASNPLYDTVVRTYVTLRSSYEINSPKIGYNTLVDTEAFLDSGQKKDNNTYMPSGDTDITPFTGALLSGTDSDGSTIHGSVKYDTSYILFEKKQVRSGDESLDSLYVVEQRIFIKKVPIRRTDVDAEFGTPLKSKETLWNKDEVIYKTTAFGTTDSTTSMATTAAAIFKRNEVPDDFFGTFLYTNSSDYQGGDDIREVGILREGRQLTDNWYAVAEREVMKVDAAGDDKFLVKSYTTYQNYTWPAVLHYIADENWTRRDGGTDTIVYPIYKKGAYSGPTKVKVELFWRVDAFVGTGTSKEGTFEDLARINPMLPEPCVFQTPIATVNVPPTLHEQILVSATTGSSHPVYDYIGTRWLFNATNYTDWPESLVIADSQKPYRGGYLREKITAYKPEAGT